MLGVAHIASPQFDDRTVEGLLLEAALRELDDLAVVGRDKAGRSKQVGLAQPPARHLLAVALVAEMGPDEVEGAMPIGLYVAR